MLYLQLLGREQRHDFTHSSLICGVVARSGARRVLGWDARESEFVEVGSEALAGSVSSQGTHGCYPIKVQLCNRYERPEKLCRGLDFHQVFLEVDLPPVQVLRIRATPRNGGVRACDPTCPLQYRRVWLCGRRPWARSRCTEHAHGHQIFVRVDAGRTITVWVRSWNDSVHDVQERIHSKVCAPAYRHRLIFAGKQLTRRDHALADYGIGKGSSLELLGRPCGEMLAKADATNGDATMTPAESAPAVITRGLLRVEGQACPCRHGNHRPLWYLLLREGLEEAQLPFVKLLFKMGTLE